MRRPHALLQSIVFLAALIAPFCGTPTCAAGATSTGYGEKVYGADLRIPNLHNLGWVYGRTNIFRSASPVRDLVSDTGYLQPDAEPIARARAKRLYDLGIRTMVSLERPISAHSREAHHHKAKFRSRMARLNLERRAAEAVGIEWLSYPLSNAGRHSLEDMTDAEVYHRLEFITQAIVKCSEHGGVLFHCSAGEDRTGLVAAYIRVRHQHWRLDQAIAEMRKYGHDWPKFSRNGGISSWHEDHLRAIYRRLFQ